MLHICVMGAACHHVKEALHEHNQGVQSAENTLGDKRQIANATVKMS